MDCVRTVPPDVKSGQDFPFVITQPSGNARQQDNVIRPATILDGRYRIRHDRDGLSGDLCDATGRVAPDPGHPVDSAGRSGVRAFNSKPALPHIAHETLTVSRRHHHPAPAQIYRNETAITIDDDVWCFHQQDGHETGCDNRECAQAYSVAQDAKPYPAYCHDHETGCRHRGHNRH